MEVQEGGTKFSFDMTSREQEVMFENGLKSLNSRKVEDHCYTHYKKARDAVIKLGIMDAIVKGIKHEEERQATSFKK